MAAKNHDSVCCAGVMTKTPAIKLSFVIPVCNETLVLKDLIDKISGIPEVAGSMYEMVFVDDGHRCALFLDDRAGLATASPSGGNTIDDDWP